MFPHSPLFGYTYSISACFDKSAECKKINEFIKSLVHPENVPILYEIPALALLQNPWVQKAYMLVGSGSNGKSTYLKLIEAFIGDENVSHVSLQALCNGGFEKAEIAGKLANIYADLPEKGIRHTGEFKVLTGGDSTIAQKKFKDPFKFVNTAIMVFSANTTPEINDDSFAFWRRWIIVEFPFTFREDVEFFKNLLDERELSGFLNEVLKAMLRVEVEGKITKTKVVEEAMKEWKKRSNSIFAFVSDCCIKDSNSVVPKDELYRKYVEFCESENLAPKSKDRFGKELIKFAPYVVSGKRRVEGVSTRVWIGIKVKEQNEVTEVEDFWGSCSYCGEYTLIRYKDGNGHYMCENCKNKEEVRGDE